MFNYFHGSKICYVFQKNRIFSKKHEIQWIIAASFKFDGISLLKELLKYHSINYLFYDVSSLSYFSYLGSTNFSDAYVFKNNQEIHVSDLLHPKDKQFWRRNVIRDGKTWGVKQQNVLFKSRDYQQMETYYFD